MSKTKKKIYTNFYKFNTTGLVKLVPREYFTLKKTHTHSHDIATIQTQDLIVTGGRSSTQPTAGNFREWKNSYRGKNNNLFFIHEIRKTTKHVAAFFIKYLSADGNDYENNYLREKNNN